MCPLLTRHIGRPLHRRLGNHRYPGVSRATSRVAGRAAADDSGSCERPHFGRSRSFQHTRARFKRRPRCAHIVHEHDDRAVHRSAVARERERVAHVAVPLCGRESGLSGGRADALQRGDRRQTEATREIGRLVESSLAQSRGVQRHRDRAARGVENVRPPHAHQICQRPGERSAPFVFHRVHDCAQRAVVGADRPRAIEAVRRAAASWTPRERHADGAPRR